MPKSAIILFFVILVLVPVYAFAQAESPSYCPEGTKPEVKCLKNPIGFLNINEPRELVMKVLLFFPSIMGGMAIAFTVFSGFKLIIASNEEAIKEAREAIKWSVGGFVLALLSFTIIAGASKLLGFDPNKIGLATDTLDSPLSLPEKYDSRNFLSVLNFVMVNFLGLIGFATTLMIIYYGYKYITAAGSEESIEQAKVGLRWALAGLIVVLLAFTIISSIRKYLVFGL